MDDLISEDNRLFEEELLRDPYSLKKWLVYLENNPEQAGSSLEELMRSGLVRNFIFERALALLPGSYKLWKMYLDERVARLFQSLRLVRDSGDDERKHELLCSELVLINDSYERALDILGRMPRLWLDYATFRMRQRSISGTRLALDRALRALPLTLHDRIWQLYIKFATALEGPAPISAASIWRRYWGVAADKSNPKVASQYVAMLLRCHFYDEAASLLAELAKDEPQVLQTTAAEEGRELVPGQYWQKLSEVIKFHGGEIRRTPVESILREAIQKATSKSNFANLQQRRDSDGPIYATGLYWNSLATWHIRHGRFAEARATYEEAINCVPTVRDFSLVFDAYAKMEESLLTVLLERRASKKARTNKEAAEDPELDERLAAFENLMDRRPFLLSSVRLRQQPNNVNIWLERIALYEKSCPDQLVQVFEDAVSSVVPKRAKGASTTLLWKEYAKYYYGDARKDFQEARNVLRRAIRQDYESVDELADVWIALAELELTANSIEAALDTLGEAAVPPAKGTLGSAALLFKNIKLWNYILDLEEARGLVEPVRSAYERVFELGIATPQTFINYAYFLSAQPNDNAEEVHRIYERGIASFGYPVAFDLWNIYLPKAVEYYAPKIERMRDLFEQALQGCPAHLSLPIFIKFAEVEERFGMGRNALRILQRAAHSVAEKNRTQVYELLLGKTQSLLGVSALRSVYEDAILHVPTRDVVDLAMRYARLEISLGEFERARAIYASASAQADPRTQPSLWAAWQEFEARHGTESSFREMLRIKRSVSAKFVALLPFVPATGDTDTAPENGITANTNNEDEINLD